LATTGEVNVRNTIGKGEFAITCKTIQHKRKAFVAFNISGTFEKFVQYRAHKVL
jgi:hypothetical protein